MKGVTVEIKQLEHGAGLDLPHYATADSAGADILAAVDEDVTLAPGARAMIPGGFAMGLPPGFEAQVRPRSGLAAKNGVTCLNTPGTIDADYRGEVKVPLINHGREPFTVTRHMRVAQMLIKPVQQIQWQPVDELPQTRRGEGGFGHTGH